jgi:serine/threonine protein kinase
MDPPKRIGKYVFEEFLGGGMTHVFRARDVVIGRTVAVKILTEAGCKDPEAKERFLAEARLAGNIQHENILSIYDYGEDEQHRPYMVMEFLTGEDLRHAIRDGHTGDVGSKVKIALQIARALAHIHGQKIVHRDIKPENIHITPQGVVKLMDFGIAKTEGLSMTRAGYTLGTPYYMAPEQIMGQSMTGQVDVYAFGVLLFELFTGKKPVVGETVERVFYSILNEPLNLEPLRESGAPPSVCALVARCTLKNPAERPQGFEPICAELEKVLAELSAATMAAPPRMQSLPAAPSQSRAPRWLLVLIPVVVLLAFVLVFALTRPGGAVNGPEEPGYGIWILVFALMAGGIAVGVLALRRRSARTFERIDLSGIAPQPSPAVPAVPANPPLPRPQQPPGEFTRMFATTPASGPHSEASVPAPPTERVEEYTRMLRVGKAEPAPPESTIPDVALAITACNDATMVGKQFRIRSFPFRIGRPAGDLPLAFDEAISRQHAELTYTNGAFGIRDLGSANGTFVNGKRLRPGEAEPLLFGARILLGSNTLLTFVSNELTELPDMVGALIGGRYRLSEKLLASAKSAVYRADDTKLPQAVLVKILSPRLANHPGYREQFEREARVAARLQHPFITRVLDYGDSELPDNAGGSLFICMPYLEGGSLAHRLAKEERFEAAEVAGWIGKLADGLQYVHEQKIVHGGIKPSAIVFDAAGCPYLTDFAIAVTADDQSQRTVIGSPPFLAPEQWEGGSVSPATDQYSLAVLFYLILCGSYPYEGQDQPAARKRNYLHGAMPAHEMARRNGCPEVPADVSVVLQRAMSVDPASRFPNILEFGRSVAEALTHPGPARPACPRVFISYRRDSGSAWALLFKSELDREYGCDVFVDSEQRDRAGNFPQKLERNVQRCDVFVCLLAANTLESAWVVREIELAHQANKPMVPVFLESFEHPRDLSLLPPHVRELLLYDGVKLLDRQNIFIPAAIQRLSEIIRQSLPDQQHRTAGGASGGNW